MLEMPQFGVSSSAVRERAAAGRPLRYLVPGVGRPLHRREGGLLVSELDSRRALALRLAELADSKGATDIVVLDMRKLVSYTDFLVICTARNERQAQAIVDEVRAAAQAASRGCCPAAPTGRGRRAGSCSTISTRCCTSSPTRRASDTSSRTSGARRPRARCSALAPEWRPRAPLRCRAWVASRGPSSATAARKWTRRFRHATRRHRGRGEPPGCAERPRSRRSSARSPGMVIEREREIRGLSERLREANERHERSIASLEAVTARLQEIEAQARGQATRIRMKALREAVEVSRRMQELSGAEAGASRRRPDGDAPMADAEATPGRSSRARSRSRSARWATTPSWSASRTRSASSAPRRSRSSASPRAGRRSRCSSTSRSTLLRELEERSPLEFKVRRTADDGLILDVDEDEGPEQRAA